MTHDAVVAHLARDCATLGLNLPPERLGLLAEYLAQMQRWNRTYNLTAIKNPEQMRVQHIVDSLAVVAPLAQRLATVAHDVRIMDVGSGGGLPGVVLAVARPDWQVCCVDAVEKKTAFVRQMAGTLKLDNLSAQHARVETLPPAGCDIVVSRAFASLDDFATLAGRHLREDGTLAAMKGRVPDDEISVIQQHGQWRVASIAPLAVPGLDAQRCLVWLQRAPAAL